jgi:hypothetical protein
MSNTKIKQLLKQQIQMLKKLQVNTLDKEDNVDEELEERTLSNQFYCRPLPNLRS